MHGDHDPLRPHSHEPNPEPPPGDASFLVTWRGQPLRSVTPADLRLMPSTTVPDCYIVSTGHGTSGPFAFTGVPLLAFLAAVLPAEAAWTEVAVHSGDGFGYRLRRDELTALPPARPALLAHAVDGRSLTRREGLVRLIEPNETGDALRQVKWIARIEVQ